jgi:hypothetical protein
MIGKDLQDKEHIGTVSGFDDVKACIAKADELAPPGDFDRGPRMHYKCVDEEGTVKAEGFKRKLTP